MTKAKIDFSLPIVIICEEVRKELTYKDTILGAIPDGLGIASFPASVRFAIWASVETFEFEAGKHKIKFFLTETKSAKKNFHELTIEFQFHSFGSSKFAIHTPVNFLQLNKPCDLFLWYSLDDRPPVFIKKIEFKEMDASTFPGQ